MSVTAADGNTLPVTKIGDIQMTNAGFTIPGVHLVPGLKFDLISVRELTRQSRICTWFDGDRAMLYAGPDLVGLAVAPQEKSGLYVLESLSVPEIAAADSSGNCLDGEMKLLPVWCGSSARGSRSQSTKRGASFPDSVSIRENSFGSMSSMCKNSFGSVLCWLKALPHATPLFGAGPEEKPMREPHVSNERGKRRRTQGEGDSCWRTTD
jgi:hypothetical protein